MDSLVQGTNDSSILSKLSMVRRGYFQDDFIHHFVAKEVRRSPLIHLGYFARALVMDRHVRLFLESVTDSDPQILSLGAGFDTTFFRLQSTFPNVRYFEVDLPDVVRKKIVVVENSKELNSVVTGGQGFQRGPNLDSLSSERYSIFVHDLSNLEGLADKLQQLGFDFDRPTLIISECAITYIEEERSTNLIRWAAENMPNGTFMNYEQITPDDGFGQVMISHFVKIQSPLRSLSAHKNLRDQQQRYLKAGWARCHVVSVMDLLRSLLSPSELVEIFKKEPFDEWEEFHLKCCHYSLAVATHGTPFTPQISSLQVSNVVKEGFKPLTSLPQLRLQRYAHAICHLSDGFALVIGGFGALPGRPHSRFSDVQYVGKRSKNVRLALHSFPGSLDSLYHSCTPLGGDEFVIYGGRTSPAREVNCDPLLLSVIPRDADNIEVRVQKMALEKDAKPPPRWRHAAVFFHGAVIVFGGRNKNLEVLGDLWELSPAGGNSWTWREIRRSPTQNWPQPRFSHAFASDGNTVHLSGGLDAYFRPLSDVWQLSKQEGELVWKEVKLTPTIPSVYSHNMHCYHTKIILLGGVNESHSQQPQLAVVDLRDSSTRIYSLKAVDDKCTILLHNFCSVFIEEDDSIICYGGGGNCFSFGTHFNEQAMKLSNLANL